MLQDRIKQSLRDVVDFPKRGIVFKDITPVLKDAHLCEAIAQALANEAKKLNVDVVVGIESRGFLFGMQIASLLKVPFVPIRKKGKLPYKTVSQSYALEYGEAELEIHEDALFPGQRVLVHDDLLATGGTVVAASKLVQKLGANLAGYSFLISLDFLDGKKRLATYCPKIFSLASY